MELAEGYRRLLAAILSRIDGSFVKIPFFYYGKFKS